MFSDFLSNSIPDKFIADTKICEKKTDFKFQIALNFPGIPRNFDSYFVEINSNK